MGKEFKRAQGFGSPLQKHIAVRTGEFNQNIRGLKLLANSDGRVYGDAVFQLERA